jgi:hypothetical protein
MPTPLSCQLLLGMAISAPPMRWNYVSGRCSLAGFSNAENSTADDRAVVIPTATAAQSDFMLM